MMPSFVDLPEADAFALRNATLPAIVTDGYAGPVGEGSREGLLTADVVISGGRISRIAPPGQAPANLPSVDLRGGQVWPAFTDMHTHLDKGHIWARRPNPDGTFDGAIDAVRRDREAHWSAKDVKARMDFSLRCAYAHGTKLLRTHIDSVDPQHRVSWPAFSDIRAQWEGRIDLQAAALFPLELCADERFFRDLIVEVVAHDGILGGVTHMGPGLDSLLDRLFAAAADNGLDVDLHVDETADAEARTLRAIAEAALRNRYQGQVVVGHCCSLARQDAREAAETVEKVAEAGLAVVSLPMCNMYLQDRHAGRTPTWRGVTLFHELAVAGVATAVASDNTRDPFYAYGDLDPVEVFREAVRVLHLDHPLDEAARVITTTPSTVMRRPDVGRIASGRSADLVLFNARSWTELLSRPQADRLVMRRGRSIDTTLPDYRELDDILGV